MGYLLGLYYGSNTLLITCLVDLDHRLSYLKGIDLILFYSYAPPCGSSSIQGLNIIVYTGNSLTCEPADHGTLTCSFGEVREMQRTGGHGELGPSKFSRWCCRFHVGLLVYPRCEKFAALTSNRQASYACSVRTSLV